ncbi:MAG: hypothetical protein Q8Q02_08640 [Nocardioides sp.]|nr:hypothetical protein [Nocardioides sp.]
MSASAPSSASPGPPVDLAVTLGGTRLTNPVLTAAGCVRLGRDLEQLLDLPALGAYVTPTVTLHPVTGPPGRRVVESPSGFVHATGLAGPGLSGFLATELPWLAARSVRTIVSVAAASLGEYAELARHIAAAPGVTGVEVRLGPPGAAALGLHRSDEPYHAAKVLATVRRELPSGALLLAKLAPLPGRVGEFARACADAGADGVTVADAAEALALDPTTLRPALGSGARDVPHAGLSGPALHPIALRCVWEAHAAVPTLPVVGCGGVASAADALAMIAAGATAVQVGSSVFADPTTPARVLAGLADLVSGHGATAVAGLVGYAHRPEHAPARTLATPTEGPEGVRR